MRSLKVPMVPTSLLLPSHKPLQEIEHATRTTEDCIRIFAKLKWTSLPVRTGHGPMSPSVFPVPACVVSRLCTAPYVVTHGVISRFLDSHHGRKQE